MDHYDLEHFARNSRRVRSPLSHRRAQRLVRFGIASGAIALIGLALLVVTILDV